jgi:hypothetical protein
MNHQQTPHPTLAAIANLIHQLRPEWDTTGIMSALVTARLRVGVTPADLAIAAVKAASNPSNRTPAIIPLDGDHWREHNRPLTTPQPPGKCQVCHGYHTPDAPHNRPYTPSDWRGALANVRAAYTQATAGLCPHGVPWTNCHQHKETA